MDGIKLFQDCLGQSTAVVKQVRFDHFANSTPNSDWNVRDLLGHMLYELSWVPDLLAGLSIEETGTKYEDDLVGDDDVALSSNWQLAVDQAERAIEEIDLEETAHLSTGEIPVEDYLVRAATDQLIHSWDLGKAIGVPVHFNPELAKIIYENTKPQRQMLEESGLFAAEVTVDDTADIQTRLLALFGRRADWQTV
jgi:uncharacterized protein (TIGR03086 family)